MNQIDNLVKQLKLLLPSDWGIHTERLDAISEAYWSLGKTKDTYEMVIEVSGLGVSMLLQPEGLPPKACFTIASMVRNAIDLKLSEEKDRQGLKEQFEQAKN